MMACFECHITYLGGNEEELTELGNRHDFHFSKIDGDEAMGPGVKQYLTRSAENFTELYTSMIVVCGTSRWTRRKIEAILIDERS